ncbi:nucleoporin nup211 isoform X1 [Actinidia eriantha]|uniref:nucleoporin nup211 isoform X1 n=1 Tax=Actinidia eriantha TaxID=165200 RepID=UPI00258C9796|nr:nucleoporin nup211 isoform X1 [Actinidia eriantha]
MASEKDEMDSLFEGMVLFNLSQMADVDVDHHHQQQEQKQHHHTTDFPPPSDDTCCSAGAASSSASQPLDENLFSDLTLITPLQNQLTLQVQAQPHTPPSPNNITAAAAAATGTTTTTTRSSSASANGVAVPSSSSVGVLSRQISTRKKKRAGLRIGYGREAHSPIPIPIPPDDDDDDDDDDQLPQSLHHADGLSLEPELPTPTPPLPSPSFTAQSESESESIGSAPQRQQPLQPVFPSTATTTVGEPTCSNSTNDALRGDNMVSDAPSKANAGVAPIELRFEQIRAQISQKIRHVRELVASVSAARKDSTRRRRKAADTLNLESSRYAQLEKELEEACEAEDFETAERVSESVASAEKNKERLAIDLRLAEADCDAVDSKMQEVLEQQIAAEEECASLLKILSMDAASDADLLQENATVESERELDRWLSLTEDLELKKMELDIESHLMNSARLMVSDSIEHSVEDDRRHRELLCKRKEMLTEELVKLLALVKEKEVEIAEIDLNIETVEKRIADVVSSFQEVQSSVKSKYDNLQSGLSQMELDNEALTRKKKEIDDFLSQEKDRARKLQELAQIFANEASMYQEVVELRKSLVLFILKSREDKVRLAKTEEKLSEDVHLLRQEISATRASLQKLSSNKYSFQQEIESLKQRLVFVDKRVPDLETEKKVAAAARNFKEAARIAAESKALGVEKESLQIKLAGAVLELGKLEEELCNAVNKLQETEGQISTKEKEVAIARFQRLLLIAGAAKAERSASLELGDLDEADILLAEAEAAESEARKIQPVYNFKEEEFANLPKQYISMELVSNLGGKQLAELAASAYTYTQ